MIPYLFFDIGLQLIFQIPLDAFYDFENVWSKVLGIVHVWRTEPKTLFFTEDIEVKTYASPLLFALLSKGFALFIVGI